MFGDLLRSMPDEEGGSRPRDTDRTYVKVPMPEDDRRTQNRRGEGLQLREEIVRAAARLIAENGGDSLTLRAVARAAGITAPSIYAHFADLNEVMKAVVETTFHALVTHLRRTVTDIEDPVARLRAACQGYVTFALEEPNQYRVLFNAYPYRLATRPHKTVDTIRGADAFAFLHDGIRDCVAAGRSRSVEPALDATALWVALHGYVSLQAGVRNFPWPPEDDLINALVDRLAQLNTVNADLPCRA
jgi:AcrR family transcriptional regulator